MHRHSEMNRRAIPALAAVCLVGVGLAGCGGGVPRDAVAMVSHTPIPFSAFNYWMKNAVARSAHTNGGKAVVPVPPKYTACVASKKAIQAQSQAPLSSAAVLRSDCRAERAALVDGVMAFLISAQWIFQEASKLGVTVNAEELRSEFGALNRKVFSPREFKAFLARSGDTVPDLLLREIIELSFARIEKKVTSEATATVTDGAIAHYYDIHKTL